MEYHAFVAAHANGTEDRMPEITPLGVAVLALLAERPMHPYEMFQVMTARFAERVVKVRPGSLYHTVDRMTGQSLVRAAGTEREGNRPERTTYEITEAGHLALTQRLTDILSRPVNEYPSLPLALGEAHNLPRDTVCTLLDRRLVALGATLDSLLAGRATVTERGVAERFWIDLELQIAMTEAEVRWITALVERLRAGAIDW